MIDFRTLFSKFRLYIGSRFRRQPVQTLAVAEERCLAPIEAPQPPSVRVTAVEVLRNEPNLTPAELAAKAAVSLAYASSLVRKQRRAQISKAPNLFSVPPTNAEAPAKHRILEMAAAGKEPAEIAQSLNLSPGEIEFAIKVSRLRKIA